MNKYVLFMIMTLFLIFITKINKYKLILVFKQNESSDFYFK